MKPDPRQIVTDRPLRFQWTALLILTLLLVLGGSYLYGRVAGSAAGMLFDDLSLVWVIAVLFLLIVAKGIYTNQPNQAVVASLFGRYVGTEGHTGLRFSNPLHVRRHVSRRVQNFETGNLKVNDLDGNPIEIAAIVVWQVTDAAEAVFNVEDYPSFLRVQSESAVREIASLHAYDAPEGRLSLRANAAEISDLLQASISAQVDQAGLRIIGARISHLAYSPEIAQAMLQRQQATAVVAARQQIVAGAVGMVEDALRELSARNVVEFSDEQKAQMAANLLTVLCSDRPAHPVVSVSSGTAGTGRLAG